MIRSVEGINESAAQAKRERALNSIDVKIAEVVKSLDQVQATADLRNKALLFLQELKSKVAGLSSIPKIIYLQEQAGALLDDATCRRSIGKLKPRLKPTSSGSRPSCLMRYGPANGHGSANGIMVMHNADLA